MFKPWLSLLMIASLMGACASSGLSGNVFRSDDLAFRVGPVPTDWRLLDDELTQADLASFAYRDDDEQVTIGAAGRCNRDGDDVPLRSLTRHLYLGFTDRSIHSEQKLRLDGRQALRTEMTAALDGVPKHLVLVVLKKDNCVYDFWRVADNPPRGGTQEFDAFVSGFQTLQ